MKQIFAIITLFTIFISTPSVAEEKKAVFAGGCFWCMEGPFEKLDGVSTVISGFAGGYVENPSYRQVVGGGTGHIEVVEVTYDDEIIEYQTLLETYWANIDPVDNSGQFCDRGHSYTSAIFTTDEKQKELAEQSKSIISKKFDKEIATRIRDLDAFYSAEDYHQDYYKTNKTKYKYYRWRCGRDNRLEELWDNNAGKSIPIFN